MSSQNSKLTFKDTFSFKNANLVMEAQLKEKLCVRLERVGPAIARLYFVKDAAEVNIPEGIEVIDETNGGLTVLPLIHTQSFVLAWTDNYTVKYNGEPVLGLTNQRRWTITGKREVEFHSVEY